MAAQVKTRIELVAYVGDSEVQRQDNQPVYGDRVVQMTFVHGRKTVQREFRMETNGLKIVPNTTKYT
jgi:hypothetical protein